MTTDSLRGGRQVDLDQLKRDFTKWQGRYQDFVLQNGNLQQELTSINAQVTQDKTAVKSAQEEIKQLRGIISNLQNNLAKRCDLEDDNKCLKEHSCRLEERIKTLKEENEAAILGTEARLEEDHAKAMAEMEQAHSQQIKQMEEQVTNLQTSLQDRSAKVGRLNQELLEAEENRKTEIGKLRLEYDAKIQKVQTANPRTTFNRSEKPSSASSLIFREKMLNAQAASEREVASLKQTLSELKRKLDGHQTTGTKRKR